MNNKVKNIVPDHMTCDRYITRIIRQEKALRKPGNSNAPHYQDKISIVPKATSPIQTRIKSLKSRQASPIKNNTITTILQPPSSASPQLSVDVDKDLNKFVKPRQRHRSVSSCSSHRESWGQLLQSNKSREKASSFSNFDPLRTLHFLSKELHFKLQTVLPEEVAVQQIVYDIQHALKRIPPEVASLIHLHSGSLKSLDGEEKCITVLKPTTVLNKCCQTPPTLFQEDSEGFHRMMEENTHKLAVSCKQLELVCTNLQQEKELTEKELENSRENIASLKKRVKELEAQTEPSSAAKRVKQLEWENQRLQEKVDHLMQTVPNDSSSDNLKKLVDELRMEKAASDQNRAKLEYDMTLLSLEKEKFVTMLAVRDREIKEIQEEMSRIQEQVSAELKRLHSDVISRVSSVKSLTDNLSAEENRIGIGDATISSIRADDTNGRDFLKESPCGDAEMGNKTDNFVERLTAQIKAINTKFELPPPADQHNQNSSSLQERLKEMSSTNPFSGSKNS